MLLDYLVKMRGKVNKHSPHAIHDGGKLGSLEYCRGHFIWVVCLGLFGAAGVNLVGLFGLFPALVTWHGVYFHEGALLLLSACLWLLLLSFFLLSGRSFVPYLLSLVVHLLEELLSLRHHLHQIPKRGVEVLLESRRQLKVTGVRRNVREW